MSDNKKTELQLIPKSETYIQYMIDVIFKLTRTEKFSMGTEYKKSMYKNRWIDEKNSMLHQT